MFIINILNKFILRIFNYFFILNNIIILLIAISTILIVKKVKTGFNFQNWHYIIIKIYLI